MFPSWAATTFSSMRNVSSYWVNEPENASASATGWTVRLARADLETTRLDFVLVARGLR